MKFKAWATVSFLVISVCLHGQSDIPIGTWREHYSYNSICKIVVDDPYVYASTGSALLVLNESENELSTLTKLSGLTGSNISSIAASNGILIIGYEDGNLDVIEGNAIVNINSIANSNINSSKRINAITIVGSIAYASTDYGVSLVNIEQRVLGNSYINLSDEGDKLRINQTVIFDDSLFLATDQGILSAPQSGINLLNFRNWKRTANASIDGNIVSKLVVNGTSIFAIVDGQDLFAYQNRVWNEISDLPSGSVTDIASYGQGVSLILGNQIWTYDEQAIQNSYPFGSPQTVASSLDKVWVGDKRFGLVDLASGLNYIADGPASQNYFSMQFTGSTLEAFAGINAQLSIGLDLGFSQFNSGMWEENLDNLPEVTGSTARINRSYATTEGIWIADGDEIIQDQNYPEPGIVTAIAESNDGIWTSILGSSLYFLPQGNSVWQEHEINNVRGENVVKILPIPNGDLWLQVSHQVGGGILVYSPTTQEQRWLSTALNEGELPNNEVTDLEIDKNDQVWVTTKQGLAVYPSPANTLIDSSVQPIVPVFGNQFLFFEKEIFDVEVDGGNRKWFSTLDGVWLLDKYGEELVHHFHAGNSPLPSNSVQKIEINEVTGEVFFLSEEGILSFRGDATQPNPSLETNIEIFPNPVTNDFEGHIGMKGLDQNSIVKITDIGGNLIWQTKSQGGTATWHLKDYNGQRAQTGVYLVFSVSEPNSAKLVGKIAVIN